MNYNVTISGRDHVVTIDQDGVRVDGEPVDARLVPVSGDSTAGRCVVTIDNAAHAIDYRYTGAAEGTKGWSVSSDGLSVEAVVLDDRERQIREMVAATSKARGPGPVKAPMPGMVVKVEVSVGDRVEVGQGVVVVEAMKMENELQAQSAGVVAAIHAIAGEAVEKDEVLIEFRTPDDEANHGG